MRRSDVLSIFGGIVFFRTSRRGIRGLLRMLDKPRGEDYDSDALVGSSRDVASRPATAEFVLLEPRAQSVPSANSRRFH